MLEPGSPRKARVSGNSLSSDITSAERRESRQRLECAFNAAEAHFGINGITNCYDFDNRQRIAKTLSEKGGRSAVFGSKASFGQAHKRAIWGGTSATRRALGRLLDLYCFQLGIAGCILTSIALAVFEANAGAMNQGLPQWFGLLMATLTVIYLLEILARLYVSGPYFFRDYMNSFEGMVVLVDVAFFAYELISGEQGQQLLILRACRLVRVLRIIRLLYLFRPLFLMLHGLFNALHSLVWATVLLLVIIGFWSILAVNLLHPINEAIERDHCEHCSTAFSSVQRSCLTFLETVLQGATFDHDVALPIIQKAPWTFLVFLGVHITANIGIMNLIIAVIVDKANQAREECHENQLFERQNKFEKAKAHLLEMCKELDTDDSGTLTLDEIVQGVTEVPAFASMLKLLSVGADDLDALFSILDDDNSGDVDYNEFCSQLHHMKTVDSQSLLVFIKFYVMEMRDLLMNQISDEFVELKSKLLRKTQREYRKTLSGETNTPYKQFMFQKASVPSADPDQVVLSPSSPAPFDAIDDSLHDDGFYCSGFNDDSFYDVSAHDDGSFEVARYSQVPLSGSNNDSQGGGAFPRRSALVETIEPGCVSRIPVPSPRICPGSRKRPSIANGDQTALASRSFGADHKRVMGMGTQPSAKDTQENKSRSSFKGVTFSGTQQQVFFSDSDAAEDPTVRSVDSLVGNSGDPNRDMW